MPCVILYFFCSVDKSWKMLTSALSGLFCASLNFVEKLNSLSPNLSFPPTGAVPSSLAKNSSLLRYSTLPREVVCTENLTPWKKLLPCDSKVKTLHQYNLTFSLRSHIFSAWLINFAECRLHLQYKLPLLGNPRPTCVHGNYLNNFDLWFTNSDQFICQDASCEKTSVELKQTVSLIYDMLQVGSQGRDWSFRKLFGQGLAGACPLASGSRVFVDLTQNNVSRI
jgi:GPI-anchor transamidase subunit T